MPNKRAVDKRNISLWVPSAAKDRYQKMAALTGQSLSAYVYDALEYHQRVTLGLLAPPKRKL